MSAPPSPPETQAVDNIGIAGALLAVSVWGIASIIPKELALGGLAIAAYRFGMYALAAGAVMSVRGNLLGGRVMRASFGGGLALGLDVAFFFSAIKLTSVANATVIGALQPIVVAIIANRVFGEVIRRRDLALGAVAIVGVAVVVFSGAADAPTDWRGDLLAVGALFAWSGYFVMSKRAQTTITTNEYTVGAAVWVALINAPLAALFGQSLGLPNGEEWLWLAAMAFGAGVLGHAVMNWSLKQIPLWLGSTFTLLVPVVSTSAAWLFLDEPVTVVQAAAIGVVLLSLAGVITGQAGIGSRPRPLRR
ncbi:MAG: DMT family transporter [Actinomycetota bacterium]